jgi:GNAT superfamily N-acetyltransferase
MKRMEWSRGFFTMTDSVEKVDMDAVCEMLATSYWAAARPRETIETSLQSSVCLSVFHERKQVGFLRAVTDRATFTWICDVIVSEAYRGQGLGKWLMACAVEHPALQDTHMMLGTRDAHGLYEQYGFVRKDSMIRIKNQTAVIGRSGS